MSADVKVVIIDCEKAGLIGGPFQVLVLKPGQHVAMRGGLKTLARAEQVRDELRAVFARRAVA